MPPARASHIKPCFAVDGETRKGTYRRNWWPKTRFFSERHGAQPPADRPSLLQPSRTQLSAHCTRRVFPGRSGSARPSCNAYPFAGRLPRPEEWPQNEVAEGASSCLSHALLLHSLRTAASHTELRPTTNKIICIRILCNVSQRIVLDILLTLGV